MDGNKKNLLDAPYYSQWLDVKDADWQYRSCGIAALKMAMEFLDKDAANSSLRRPTSKWINLDDLIREGLVLGAYKQNVGWVHDGLVALAAEHGFKNSFRKEWAIERSPTSLNEGIEFVTSTLEERISVIASVKGRDTGHLILLIGFEKEGGELKGFYCHDPDAKKASEGVNKFIPAKDFLELWKGRIIVVNK
ncbi:hypothetical protein A2662_01770 [Candidatus Giovannonibacteria bacterium RIFCSPHIGHO2_01_FULL_45_33]|uniref:Peptidase C39-like domain-containing protein n=1 Tax=Candidatus Giovannonibacteria bacterium RIFCSPLOWO2_01_FULL_45_34 TaxID=1798351 RepID=A0A1F5WYS4_9BACT|nr:MAG: hypothetical protein A2662_01770 [Candidatus Giovannonibacteria bacterium RIFCSPHIGHO2_01_FULL_45_33]OGF71007.1 MAG: hypothetical protein A3C73_04275 [Candidatus Giovannonibacteria bacterium RIFCSPHIGHO2_02_FULL_44_11]OGF80794.1 MAG: hypothetical protein A2930_01535 [Candidatus Giovannonibacteria bacterium RIFCSPLOWO2_01_FULL_45_34]